MISIFIFISGLCIGSFLNVVVYRTHEGISIWRGRSVCVHCKKHINVFDLIPLLSFVLLRGKCRSCQKKISINYPILEFVTGLLFLIAYNKVFLGPAISFNVSTNIIFFIRDAVFVSALLVIFVYDLRFMHILDRFTIPVMIFALIMNVWLGAVSLTAMVTGAIMIGGFFCLQYLISKGTWVGGGDIRMGILMGIMLGWKFGLVALFLAYAFGAVVGVGLLVSKKINRKTPIPFGTFLSVGTVLALFWGPFILQTYLGLFLTR